MKLWPARTAHSVKPVTDLDAIVSESVAFRFKGKTHILKPMHLEEFLKFTNAQAVMLESIKNSEEKLTPLTLAERYHAVIASVCSTITVNDILEMEQVQVAALYQLVIDAVTGQVQTGDEALKKKRQKIPLYESLGQASSLPSVQENSAGQ